MLPLPTSYLLAGPPWAAYRARRDLLGEPADDVAVQAARAAMVAHPRVAELMAALSDWPGPALKRHNDAKHPLHKLVFAADIGLRPGDPGVDALVQRVLACRSPEGVFEVRASIHPRYGGSGEEQRVWMLCDSPSVLYALYRFGLHGHPRVRDAAAHLAGLARENGWPCAVAPELGRFRGPGRKGDPCPYATLVTLKALAQSLEWRDSEACRAGAETLLGLWGDRATRKPYLFAMGTKFARLKAPLIWYDLLHVTDVLSRFAWLRDDPRLRELTAMLAGKADEAGRFRPESIWMAWRGWDFGQKREPSEWLTLLAHRILRRMEA